MEQPIYFVECRLWSRHVCVGGPNKDDPPKRVCRACRRFLVMRAFKQPEHTQHGTKPKAKPNLAIEPNHGMVRAYYLQDQLLL